jgi:precorrin-4/cobalt-precorrin-4 C11-methyltransferase
MTVGFIGAGPGAADLITVRGRDLIAAAPVCLYAGALVPVELLGHCPAGARKIDTAELTLDQIIAELVAAHEAGLDVARLHSAIPRSSARWPSRCGAWTRPESRTTSPRRTRLRRGSGLARPRADRSGGGPDRHPHPHRRPRHRHAAGEDLATLGASRATIVLHLAVQQIDRLVEELAPNYGVNCPVAVVARASRDDELILRGTLADIAAQVRDAGIVRTAVVGNVLTASEFTDSHLYSADRCRA